MTIRILSESLINRIAAGEVIVRPSSVVKELVENSMDAGSTRILVELTNECRDIRIRDDGHGIATADAPLALVRHATGKLREFDDLWDLQTRGFRGEALASIAAVARIQVLTRAEGEETGSRIWAEGDASPQIEAAGAPVGTDIRVRDLFFNTPARLKFLKSPVSELQACVSIVMRQALIRPDIGFTLRGLRGDVTMDVPPLQPWGERIAALLGAGVAEHLRPVECKANGMELTGFILSPGYTRNDRRQQYFFINGRPITSRTMSAVLSEAYKGTLMVQRFPAAVLNFRLPSGEVDVNVHPTKEEVRFRHESAVSGLLYRGVTNTLRAGAGVPQATLDGDNPNAEPQLVAPDMAFFNQSNAAPNAYPPSDPGTPQHIEFVQGGNGGGAAPHSAFGAQTMPGDFTRYTEMPAAVSPTAASVDSSDMSSLCADGTLPVPMGQIALCYIVAAVGHDMLLIDQHAAHERLLYQRFREQGLGDECVASQELLIPISLDVPPDAAAMMQDAAQLLGRYGIALEHFGGQTYLIRSVPADLPNFDAAGVVADLLGDFERDGRVGEIDALRDRIVTRMACRGAIKAGQSLALDQQAALITELVQSKMSFTCPHGRPTMVRYSLAQLDRQFKRIV